MKKFLLILFCILYTTAANSQQKNVASRFIVIGRIIGQENGQMYLGYINADGRQVFDTQRIKNERFIFSGQINEPTWAEISYNTGLFHIDVDNPNFTELFIEAGEMKITLRRNNFKSIDVKGSRTQNEFKFIKHNETTILKEITLLQRHYSDLSNASSYTKTKEEKERIANKIKDSIYRKQNELKRIEYDFITSHPKSYISSYLLLQNVSYLTLDSLNMFYNELSEKVQNSFDGNLIRNEIQKREYTKVGHFAPNFRTCDINGKEVSLSSFKGKDYVLLDFWASWCVPCRATTPFLKEMYQKYHAKGFEIVAISLDIRKDAWIKAIKQDSINSWYQVLAAKDLTQPPTQQDIISKYALDGIPTEVLIDKDGVIIGIWSGQGGENEYQLREKLVKIFNF